MPDISALTWVTMVADTDTPNDAQQYAGRVIGLPPEYATALGSGAGNPGRLLGVYGYMRTAAGGGLEWLMTQVLPIELRRAVRDLPGAHGWTSPPSRQAVLDAVRYMLVQLNLPLPDVARIVSDVFNAAVTNERTP